MTQPLMDLGSIRDLARLKPDMTADQIGREVVADASVHELRGFAAQFVADLVETLRRADAHRVEQSATHSIEPTQRLPHPDCARWLADPVTYWHISNSRNRARFKLWAGDRFNDWYRAARAAAEAATATRPDALDLFDGDWHPDGPTAYERQRRQVRIAEAMTEAVNKFADEIRLETTRELLDTVFALGDGQRITWGEATVADHRQRIALLVGNAAGTVETAARHQAAIRMIEQAGVDRLADLADAAVTA